MKRKVPQSRSSRKRNLNPQKIEEPLMISTPPLQADPPKDGFNFEFVLEPAKKSSRCLTPNINSPFGVDLKRLPLVLRSDEKFQGSDLCCSIEEATNRGANRDFSIFETKRGSSPSEIDFCLCLKKFVRSAADRKFASGEVRSLAAVLAASDLLINFVIDLDIYPLVENQVNRKSGQPFKVLTQCEYDLLIVECPYWSAKYNPLKLYSDRRYDYLEIHAYVRDRFRALRQDLSLQKIQVGRTREYIECHEQCLRFLILSQALLMEDPRFEQTQNDEQLAQCLEPLHHAYHDVRLPGNEDGWVSPNEPEIQGYSILFSLIRHTEALHIISSLNATLLAHPSVAFSLKVLEAVEIGDFYEFGRLFKLANCLQAALMYRYRGHLFSEAMAQIETCVKPRPSREVAGQFFPSLVTLDDLRAKFATFRRKADIIGHGFGCSAGPPQPAMITYLKKLEGMRIKIETGVPEKKAQKVFDEEANWELSLPSGTSWSKNLSWKRGGSWKEEADDTSWFSKTDKKWSRHSMSANEWRSEADHMPDIFQTTVEVPIGFQDAVTGPNRCYLKEIEEKSGCHRIRVWCEGTNLKVQILAPSQTVLTSASQLLDSRVLLAKNVVILAIPADDCRRLTEYLGTVKSESSADVVLDGDKHLLYIYGDSFTQGNARNLVETYLRNPLKLHAQPPPPPTSVPPAFAKVKPKPNSGSSLTKNAPLSLADEKDRAISMSIPSQQKALITAHFHAVGVDITKWSDSDWAALSRQHDSTTNLLNTIKNKFVPPHKKPMYYPVQLEEFVPLKINLLSGLVGPKGEFLNWVESRCSVTIHVPAKFDNSDPSLCFIGIFSGDPINIMRGKKATEDLIDWLSNKSSSHLPIDECLKSTYPPDSAIVRRCMEDRSRMLKLEKK